MSEFYESLKETLAKARALQLAQQEMITGEIYKQNNYIVVENQKIPLPDPNNTVNEDLSHLTGSPW